MNINFKLSGLPIILAALVVVSSCRTYQPPVVIQQDVVIEKPRPTKMPDSFSDSVYEGLSNRDAVITFYKNQQLRLAWYDSLHRDAGADSMALLIRNIRYFGLLPQRYHNSEIVSLQAMSSIGPQLPNNIQRTDALLTDAFLTLVMDLSGGVSRRNVADSIHLALFNKAIRSSSLLGTLCSVEPSYSQYQNLKEMIRTILDTTNSAVRDRILLGETSDKEPAMRLMQKVEVNLERWRLESLFSSTGKHIFVNIPAFMLYALHGDDKVLESRIIVGSVETPTPLISSKVECLVIYPYWHVPRKISVEEYLPVIQRDTSFITRNNFDVLDRKGRVLRFDSIDWKKFNKNYFPVSLRQREGVENSLGLIKFVFDNPYAVYVHDTNAKSLFRKKMRALSHGCIRVEKAFELAHYALKEESPKKSELLGISLQKKQRRMISLSKPVPIYVRYFTCAVIDNELQVYDDCYGQDEGIRSVLYGCDKNQK